MAARDKTLFVEMGLPVSLQYLYERHKVPTPDAGGALFIPTKPVAQAVPPEPTPDPAKAKSCACGCATPIDATSESSAEASAADEYLVWDATLDNRTTPLCQGHHGRRWGDGWFSPPPAHYNCRSVLIRMPKASYQSPD